MNNEIVEARLLNDPGEGFQSRDKIYTISMRLRSHTAGKIVGGYKEDKDGKLLPLANKYETGDLAPTDALYATEYALTRGLNPYGHIHLWYHRANNQPPQLIIDIDWKILKGWAEWRSPFGTESILISDESDRDKYGLETGDIGYIVYVILDQDRKYFHQYVMGLLQQGHKVREARLLSAQITAKAEGVGIVRASELVSQQGKAIAPPKGRSWQWRAETRALRDAIRRSHGEPPPGQIRQMINGSGISENQLALMASDDYPIDTPAETQQEYLQLAEQATNGERVDITLANDLMRNNGDDDPLALEEENNQDTAPAKSNGNGGKLKDNPETRFWHYVSQNEIERDKAEKFLSEANGDFDQALKALKALKK